MQLPQAWRLGTPLPYFARNAATPCAARSKRHFWRAFSLTKRTHSPWLVKSPYLLHPLFLHWSFDVGNATASVTVTSSVPNSIGYVGSRLTPAEELGGQTDGAELPAGRSWTPRRSSPAPPLSSTKTTAAWGASKSKPEKFTPMLALLPSTARHVTEPKSCRSPRRSPVLNITQPRGFSPAGSLWASK